MDKDTKINEMEITDEYVLANASESMEEIAKKLQELHNETETGAVLITQDDEEVIGFITSKEIVDHVALGKNPTEMNVKDIMSTDFVEVFADETLGQIMPLISHQYPNAIVVITPNRRCIGFFSKNDYKDAMASFGVYDQKHEPKSSDDWKTRGIALASIGKKLDALKCFEQSVSKKRDKEKSWKDLAKKLEKLNKYKEAIMCYDQAISINSKDDEALIERGKAFAKENTQSLAIQSYNLALQINPGNVDALLNMGMEQANLGYVDKALNYFEKAEEINGESADIWFKKGSAYDKAKMYEEALKCYNLAIEKDNTHEDAWFNKGVTLTMIGEEPQALNCMQEIIKLNPSNESAREAITSYENYGAFKFF